MTGGTTSHSGGGLSGLLFGPGGAATIAGAMEICIFHPFDTTAKRLMSHQQRVVGSSIGETVGNFRKVVFRGVEAAPLRAKVAHLYPGSVYAVYYKVSQRFVKFAGQPYMRDYLDKHQRDRFVGSLGEKRGKMALEATAGCIVGVSEVVLLPLDRLKVLSQTNPAALQGRSMLRIFFEEGPRRMYAGLVTTACRNAPGSFLLFGGAALTKEYAFGLQDYRRATFAQNLVASTVGACLGVLCTSPMDVVKTRIQNKAFGAGVSGGQVLTQIMRTEGPSAFFKGITPKIATTAPRLVFSYTMSLYFTRLLQGMAPRSSAVA